MYIITKNFSGAGVITANGGKGGPAGNGYGGGGGGGRIAIYYQTSNFTGMAEVKGGLGNGNNSGSPGTSGFFDVTNNYFYSGHAWVFQENDNPFEFNKIFLKGSSVTSEGAVNISTNDLSLENSNILVSGKETFNIDNLSLINSTIDSFPQARIDFNLKKFNLDVNSYILVDGKGYLAKFGLGAGKTSTWGGSGGGYGGKGGFGGIPKVEGGEIYGKDIMPFDFGSGGSGALSPGGAGAGGGAIKLTVSDTATVNGVISADGMDARQGMYYQDGGGSGGSIYLIAKNLSGTGLIKANGGKSGPDKGAAAGGGGGGGRVAVYYQISDFSGKVEAKGGIGAGCNGENGTVVIQAPSPDAAIKFFTLVEKSFTESTLSALWTVQTVNLNSAAVRGDLKGAVNFTAFETITIADGVFSGKGFSKSEFTAVLEGVSYRGACNAVVYFIPWEKKIYLKGEISGEINGVCEGFLTESNPGNGIYDKYQAVWKINRLGAEVVTVAVNLEGLLSYLSAHDFVSEFYLYQADMEGAAFGYYAGSLSAVITHLRLTGDNEYKGQGFSIISYNSSLGQGEGYSYNKLVSEVKVDFYGLFEAPIFGKFSAILEESKLPKNLTGIIERLDSGAIPKSDLKVKAWSPARVSPGETITYVIEYRNDGLKAADNVFIFCYLNTFEKYVRASAGANYSPYSHRLSWKIPALAAKSSGFFTLQTEIAWGLPAHLLLNTHVFITNVGE